MAVPSLDTLYAALTAAALAAWPEVASTGVFQAEHLSFLPFADVNPPYAFIHIRSVPRNTDYAANAWVYLIAVEVGYVAEVSGPSSGIREKLENLRDWLGQNDLSAGQVMDAPEMAWGDDIDANRMLIERANSLRCGVLTANVLFGGLP